MVLMYIHRDIQMSHRVWENEHINYGGCGHNRNKGKLSTPLTPSSEY